MLIMMLNGVKTAEEGAQLKVILAQLFMESISAEERNATLQKQLEQSKKVEPVTSEVQERKGNKKRAVKEGQKSGFWE